MAPGERRRRQGGVDRVARRGGAGEETPGAASAFSSSTSERLASTQRDPEFAPGAGAEAEAAEGLRVEKLVGEDDRGALDPDRLADPDLARRNGRGGRPAAQDARSALGPDLDECEPAGSRAEQSRAGGRRPAGRRSGRRRWPSGNQCRPRSRPARASLPVVADGRLVEATSMKSAKLTAALPPARARRAARIAGAAGRVRSKASFTNQARWTHLRPCSNGFSSWPARPSWDSPPASGALRMAGCMEPSAQPRPRPLVGLRPGGAEDRQRELRRSGGGGLRCTWRGFRIHGMVDSLDPHSEFLESKDNEELEEDLDGEYGGIGIEVEMHKGAFAVIAPIAGLARRPGRHPASATRSSASTARPVEHDVTDGHGRRPAAGKAAHARARRPRAPQRRPAPGPRPRARGDQGRSASGARG